MLKNTLNRLIFAIWGGYSYLSSEINKLYQYNFIKNSRKGAILIEFAFAVPVLFSLIYYISDLAKMKQYNERMNFVAHQIVQIIQTVSQTRNDRKITIDDLINAWKAAYLSVFPGNTVTPVTQYIYPFGYHVFYTIFYVKGIEDNTASVIWAVSFAGDGGKKNTSTSSLGKDENKNGSWYRRSNINYGEINRMVTNFSKDVSPSKIHPNLTIKKDEIKIMVQE